MSPDFQSTWIFLFFRWIVPLNYDQTITVRGRTARHISLRKMWLRRQRCHEWQRYIENIIRKYRTYLFPVKRWPDSSSLCSYMPHLSYLGIREAQLSLSYLPLWVYCSYRIKLDRLYPSRPCTWRQHNALNVERFRLTQKRKWFCVVISLRHLIHITIHEYINHEEKLWQTVISQSQNLSNPDKWRWEAS